MNMTYVYAMPLNEIAKYETIGPCRRDKTFLARGGSLVIGDDRGFRVSARRRLARFSGSRVYLAMAQDGVFFPPDGCHPSQVAHAAFSLIGPGHLGACSP